MRVKRAIDVLVSAVGLFLLAPVFALVAFAIKLDSTGPVFFRQTRMGRAFRRFQLLKFRTMVENGADQGSALTVDGDARITRVGWLLRKAKLDEFPQILNVLRGDMSLVGPRPEIPGFVERFRDDYVELLAVRPGMTDPASFKYRDEEAILARADDPEHAYVTQILPDKIRLAKAYVARRSNWFDLLIIGRTVLDAVGIRLVPIDRLNQTQRRVIVVAVHLILIVFANAAAFWLRFDGRIPPDFLPALVWGLPALLVIRGAPFAWFHLYHGLWRYTDIWDVRDVVAAIGASSLLFCGLVVGLTRWDLLPFAGYPRSVYLIDAIVLVMLMAGIRLSRRLYSAMVTTKPVTKTLIVGAGNAGERIVREMRMHGDYAPVGFVDDDRSKIGGAIHGVPVLGTRADLPRIMTDHAPDEVLIAIRGAGPKVMRQVLRALGPFTTRITTLPSLHDLISGDGRVRQVRQLAIEDLLPRAPVGLDRAPLHQLMRDRPVMVTGAGGSIGSELSRQIAALKPSALILYERYENSLYQVTNDLLDAGFARPLHSCIGDVTDSHRLDAVMSEHRPAIVFHAAAHKHVPLMEQNPCEAVKNNVVGTRLLSEAADRHGIDRFILISTDKAVNPVSVMGATKRTAELLVQAKARSSRTTFCVVRFGNVLGSNGSVLLRFVDQIKSGGPVTVTHPEISRYFMLISEAVELVLHAATKCSTGTTYVLDMGDPIKLVGLARDLIRLSGRMPADIPIQFVGLRPGEKMFEELAGLDETIEPSPTKTILCVRAQAPPDPDRLSGQIRELERLAAAGDTAGLLAQLGAIEPGFTSGGLMGPQELPRDDPEAEQPQASPKRYRHTDVSLTCPSCGFSGLYRSHARTRTEHLWKRLSDQRLHLCPKCKWRGWQMPVPKPQDPRRLFPDAAHPDLGLIDRVLHGSSSTSGKKRHHAPG